MANIEALATNYLPVLIIVWLNVTEKRTHGGSQEESGGNNDVTYTRHKIMKKKTVGKFKIYICFNNNPQQKQISC